MASAKNYTNQTALENYLLLSIDASFSSQVDDWISAAEDYVDNYIGISTGGSATASGLWNEQISGELLDARIDGDLNLVIYPRKRPINSVSAISIWKGGSFSFNLTLTNTAGVNKYIIPAQQNCVVYPSYELSISSGTYAVYSFAQIKFARFYTKMDYIAGYTAIPKDIQLATTMIAADYFMRQANKEGLVAVTQGRVSKRWADPTRPKSDRRSVFLYDAEQILENYRMASGWF